MNTYDIYERTRIENHIKDFKSRGIIRENGTIDVEKYQYWFIRFISDKESNTLHKKIELIEEANYIAKEACASLNINESYIPKDGGMKNEKITQLILSSVPKEQIKKELQETILKIVEKKEEPQAKEENAAITNDSKDDSKEDSSKDEALYKACVILLPLIRKAQLESELNGENSVENPEKEYIQILQAQGFKDAQIYKVLDTINKETLEFEKEKKKNPEVKYNAYNDWRYIYYMSSLGKGFSIYYDPKALTLRQVIAQSLAAQQAKESKEKARNQINELDFLPKDATKEKKKQLEDTFLLDVIAFRGKYDVEIDRAQLISDFFEVKTKEQFVNTYKRYVQQYYEQGKDNIEDLPAFMTSFDKLIKSTCAYMDNSQYVKYGGMRGEELFVFCMNIREEDCNITRQIEREVVRQFGRLDNVNGTSLTNYLENKVNAVNREGISEEEKHDLLRDAMACYLLLKDTHENRTRGYRVRHFIDYWKESRSVTRMKNVMERNLEHVRENEVEEFHEMERRRTVYRRGFDEERNRLRTFSIDVDREFERTASRQQINIIDEPIIDEEDRGDLLRDEDYARNQEEIGAPSIENTSSEERRE